MRKYISKVYKGGLKIWRCRFTSIGNTIIKIFEIEIPIHGKTDFILRWGPDVAIFSFRYDNLRFLIHIKAVDTTDPNLHIGNTLSTLNSSLW